MNSKKASLGVAVIVKNEEKKLAACLQAVASWVDEIVIVDAGSEDNTKEIALSFTDKYYQHPDWQGFGHQRQIAQNYVESDYILWLDADEHVSEELKDSIIKVMQNPDVSAVYQLSRLSWVFGRFIRHSGWYPDRVVRLYQKNLTAYNDNMVHEKVIVDNSMKLVTLDGDLLHYTYDNLNHYLLKSTGYAKAWADQKEKQGKKSSLLQAIAHALACFIKMYILKRGFLDGQQGLLLALLSAHSTFIKYADVWIRGLAKTK
jgi:(heptosyl)LPS beta-1,4-glucosyltransferase